MCKAYYRKLREEITVAEGYNEMYRIGRFCCRGNWPEECRRSSKRYRSRCTPPRYKNGDCGDGNMCFASCVTSVLSIEACIHPASSYD